MARLALGLTVLSPFRTLVLMMIQGGLLPLVLLAVTALAQRCTRAVPVHTYPAEKLKILKRIPSSCSNWDKTWSWFTRKDCNTKYRMETVEVPPREVRQYKLQHYCCDGADKCEEAENRHSTGFDSTDTKFLAVVLGSTAACVVIVIIIFAITFYTKKSRCVICDQDRQGYTSAGECSDPEDSREDSPVVDKTYPAEGRARGGRGRSAREHSPCWDSDTEQHEVKGTGEAVYAEIGDPGDGHLPRYADIFREDGNPGHETRSGRKTKRSKRDKNSNPDPFTNASAPPLYSEVSRTKKPTTSGREKEKCTDTYVNAPNAVRAEPMLSAGCEATPIGDALEVRIKQPVAQCSRRVSEDAIRQHSKQDVKSQPPSSNTQRREEGRSQNDPKYYNVQERKKKKRKTSSSSSGTGASSNRPESSKEGTSSNNAPGPKGKGDSRRSKASGVSATAMEMTLSKSSSASETMGKNNSECSETSLTRSKKRLSAPPGSTLYENQHELHSPEQSLNPPQPPQSAVPPRPSSVSSSSHDTDTTTNMARASNPCQVIYEAQAPPCNAEKEKRSKHGKRSSNCSSPSKPSDSQDARASSSTECTNLKVGTKSHHNYENANLVSMNSDKATDCQSGKSGVSQRPNSNSEHLNNVNSSLTPHDHHHLERAEEQEPLLSLSASTSSGKEHSGAAILNLNPGVDSRSADTAPSSQEAASATSKGMSASINTYDQLQFEEPNKMALEKAHSPSAHVYQSLESPGSIAHDIAHENISDTVEIIDNKRCEVSNGLSRENSDGHCSDGNKDCDSPPPPLLPPRCPIALNKQAVDGLSV